MRWERYQRQLGLVYQQRLASLRVLIVGDDPALTYALVNLALLGAGAAEDGALLILSNHRDEPITPDDLKGQSLLTAKDVGVPWGEAIRRNIYSINPDVRCETITPQTIGSTPDVVLALGNVLAWTGPGRHVIYGRTGRVALAFGFRPAIFLRPIERQAELQTVLTSPLASALGAVLAQEALRICKLLRPYPIERFWLSANLRLPVGVEPSEPPILNIAGTSLYSLPSMPDDDTSAAQEVGRLYRSILPFEFDLTRALWSATAVDTRGIPSHSEPHQLMYYSPFPAWHAPASELEAQSAPDGHDFPEMSSRISGRRLVVGGAGGLGSWLLMTLAAAPLSDCHFMVIESDSQVEIHNLNRQILYREEHLGMPKGAAIKGMMQELNPALSVSASDRHISVADRNWLTEVVSDADAVLTAFDNFHARYALGMAGAEAGVPIINGGAWIFSGDVELLRPGQEGCIECFWEAELGREAALKQRDSRETFSCTREDESVSQIGTAIVTTNALMGSLQALLLLAWLATPYVAGQPVEHKVQYWGQENLLTRCRLPSQLHLASCPVHQQLPHHDEHLANFSSSDVHTEYSDQWPVEESHAE